MIFKFPGSNLGCPGHGSNTIFRLEADAEGIFCKANGLNGRHNRVTILRTVNFRRVTDGHRIGSQEKAFRNFRAGMHQRAHCHHRPLGHISALQHGCAGGDIGMRSHAAPQKGDMGADKSMITDTNRITPVFNRLNGQPATG